MKQSRTTSGSLIGISTSLWNICRTPSTARRQAATAAAAITRSFATAKLFNSSRTRAWRSPSSRRNSSARRCSCTGMCAGESHAGPSSGEPFEWPQAFGPSIDCMPSRRSAPFEAYARQCDGQPHRLPVGSRRRPRTLDLPFRLGHALKVVSQNRVQQSVYDSRRFEPSV